MNLIVILVFREDIVLVCNWRKVFWFFGCGIFIEIVKVEELGCEIVKVFFGGIYGFSFVKVIKGLYFWISIMLIGGVLFMEENLKVWIDVGVICVGMGFKLIIKEVFVIKDFVLIEEKICLVIDLI